MAVPLLLAVTVLPSLGQLALRAYRDTGVGLEGLWPALILPVAVLGTYVLAARRWFGSWPVACLLLAATTVLPGAFFDRSAFLPNVALGAGLMLANFQLGKLTVRRMSLPVARDNAASDIEISYPVPDSRAQLRIRTTALALRVSLTQRVQILMPELRDARVEHVPEPTSWHPNSSTTIDVPAGPALRVRAENREWLIPVTGRDGEALVAAIHHRAKPDRGPRRSRTRLRVRRGR